MLLRCCYRVPVAGIESSWSGLADTLHSRWVLVVVVSGPDVPPFCFLGGQVRRSIQFESPRVGNKAFADAYGERWFGTRIAAWRLTYGLDPVPHLPMENLGYEHVAGEVYYNKSGQYYVAHGREDPRGADQHSILRALFHGADHCGIPLVATGAQRAEGQSWAVRPRAGADGAAASASDEGRGRSGGLVGGNTFLDSWEKRSLV